MGAGKTTVGRMVAAELARPFHDSDFQIEDELATTARRIADEGDVAELHRVEAGSLRAALADPRPAVIAAAASVADLPQLESLLGAAFLVLLDGAPSVLLERAGSADHRRPIGEAEYAALAASRRAGLEGVVDLVVDVTRASPPQVAGRIIAAFRRDEGVGPI